MTLRDLIREGVALFILLAALAAFALSFGS